MISRRADTAASWKPNWPLKLVSSDPSIFGNRKPGGVVRIEIVPAGLTAAPPVPYGWLLQLRGAKWMAYKHSAYQAWQKKPGVKATVMVDEAKMALTRDGVFSHCLPLRRNVKATDAAGEDGDWARKVARIAEVDALVPRIRALAPDVLVVTGDHSTPAALRAHSWHPVPVVLWSRHARPDDVVRFGERACVHGALGPRCRSVDLMPLMLANALRLAKYGA